MRTMGRSKSSKRPSLRARHGTGHDYITMKKLFTTHSKAACKNNLPKLKELYIKIEPKNFLAEFVMCLKCKFIIPGRSSMWENSLNFGAMFCSLILEEDHEDSPEEVAMKNTMFISSVFNFLFQASNATDHTLRQNSCQFVNKILCQLGDQAFLDEEICSKLSNHMIQRLKGKYSSVRTEAVHALHRFQEPSNPECPVISSFLYHLETDPSHNVRKAILQVLARKSSTIPHIIKRIYDVNDAVRLQAYCKLAKLRMRILTIKQRVTLLRQGLKDCSDIVRAYVGSKLLTSWLDGTNGDYFKLLYSLDVEMYADTCYLALNTLFEQNQLESLIENLNPLMEGGLIILNKLSSPIAFYWTNLAKFICKQRANEANKKEEELGRITPNLSPFVTYVRIYYKSRETRERNSQDPYFAMEFNFILLQLMDLARVYDLSDEMGRSELKNLIFEMLIDNAVKDKLIPCLVHLLVSLIPVANDRLQQLAETVSQIQDEQASDDRMRLKLREEEIHVKGQSEDAVRAQEFPKVEPLQQDLINLELEAPEPLHKEVIEYNDADVKLRVQAIKTHACMCLLDKELAIEHIILFLFELFEFKNEDTSVAALTAIFDLLHQYGLEDFKISAKDDEMPLGEGLQLTSFVKELLNHHSSAIKLAAVKGTCRLLINSRIVSASLISQLIILWFKPGEDDNGKCLNHHLEAFFSNYGILCSESLVQAFLTTLRSLFNAPATGPLSTIDITAMGQKFIKITRPRLSEKNDHINIHNNWAILICKEILEVPESGFRAILLSLLPHLYIKTDDAASPGQLQILIDKIRVTTTHKSSQRYIHRFQQILTKTRTAAKKSTRESTMIKSVGGDNSNSKMVSHSGMNSTTEYNPPTSGRLSKRVSVNHALSTVMDKDREEKRKTLKLTCASEYSCDDLDNEQ